MSPQENTFEYVHEVMFHEGFDYAFCYYETFEQVKDTKFHKLREAYIKAKEKLEQYVLDKSTIDDEDL